VDGNGNIATAGADGTRVVVLTRTDAKAERAHPTWRDGGLAIQYAERDANGVWRLYTATPDGMPPHLSGSKGLHRPVRRAGRRGRDLGLAVRDEGAGRRQ